MRDVERVLRQALIKKNQSRDALNRLEEMHRQFPLHGVSYDNTRGGRSSTHFTESPIEKYELLLDEAVEKCSKTVYISAVAVETADDLIFLLDDLKEQELLRAIYINNMDPRRVADRLRVSYKTILNRRATALTHLELLIQNNATAAALADKLMHIDDNSV